MDLYHVKHMDRIIVESMRKLQTGVDDRLEILEKAQCELMTTQRAIELSLSSVNEIIHTRRGIVSMRVGVVLTLADSDSEAVLTSTWHFNLRLRAWAHESIGLGYGVHTIEEGCIDHNGKVYTSNQTIHAFTLTIPLPIRVRDSVLSSVSLWDIDMLLEGMNRYTSGRVWAT
jgi:hypothetical protein